MLSNISIVSTTINMKQKYIFSRKNSVRIFQASSPRKSSTAMGYWIIQTATANSFPADLSLIRLSRKAASSCRPTRSYPALTYTQPPTAISWGVFSLHSRSKFEAWHRRQRKTEHFSYCPPVLATCPICPLKSADEGSSQHNHHPITFADGDDGRADRFDDA